MREFLGTLKDSGFNGFTDYKRWFLLTFQDVASHRNLVISKLAAYISFPMPSKNNMASPVI